MIIAQLGTRISYKFLEKDNKYFRSWNIEQEGQLTPGPYIHNSMRCAIAVLENHAACSNCLESAYCYHPQREKYIENIWFTVCLSTENDREIGNDIEEPADRCSRVVAWFRK